MIADHLRNLGRVGKIETPPILQICPRSSAGDRGYLRFQVFISRQNQERAPGKIWDGRETVKSQNVWDFSDI